MSIAALKLQSIVKATIKNQAQINLFSFAKEINQTQRCIFSTKPKSRKESDEKYFKNNNNNSNKFTYYAVAWFSAGASAGTAAVATKNDKKYQFDHGSAVIPHPDKKHKGGEDDLFETDVAIGVADGVGGWALEGIDPRLYANKLMEGAKISVTAGNLNPMKILKDAYEYAKQIPLGSSTACIVVLDGNVLRAANLGDSGFMVIRGNKILLKTPEQQHSFNFPFQLGASDSDRPEHAQKFDLEVLPGDIVVLGTDGLFDNIYPQEIADIVSKNSQSSSAELAATIADKASEMSTSQRDSPFAVNARRSGYAYKGGKQDDITVIVAKVGEKKAILEETPNISAKL